MLFNKSKKNKVLEKVKYATGTFGKFMGLMFEKKNNFDYALVFDFGEEKRISASIHMFFVFFRIDAVYLDKEKTVVDIARGLKPFMLNYTPKKKARFLIEISPKRGKLINIGDKLDWD